MDIQSVKTSANVPTTTQGIDPNKKIVGRKRGIITDTLGLLRTVIVTAASVSDYTIGMDLLEATTAIPPWPRPGSTPASKTASSNTVPAWALTSRLSPKTPASRASASSSADGWSNAPWAG